MRDASAARVAFGLKAHSGWCALVVIGKSGSNYRVIDRRRIELVEEGNRSGAAPYHAAVGLHPDRAREVVERGAEGAHRVAVREMQAAVERSHSLQHEIVACAVLVPAPMPQWSTEEILAVHFRMHKAEGVLFPDALAKAARACALPLVAVPEKTLWVTAEHELAVPHADLIETTAALGKAVGPPWGKDQKHAALAAMIALARVSRSRGLTTTSRRTPVLRGGAPEPER
jgi:hypothetical protein